jgi:hypothetical protein
MIRTIVLVLVVFILIRWFFPALGELVQHVLELSLSLIEQLLSAAAGALPS